LGSGHNRCFFHPEFGTLILPQEFDDDVLLGRPGAFSEHASFAQCISCVAWLRWAPNERKHVSLSNHGVATLEAHRAFPKINDDVFLFNDGGSIRWFNDDVFLFGHLFAFSRYASVSALCNSCAAWTNWAFDVAIRMDYSCRGVLFSGSAKCFQNYTESRMFLCAGKE
jgi:hypothetical protein